MSGRTIDAHVSRLRKELDLRIRNVKEVGYVLEEDNNVAIEESEDRNLKKNVSEEEGILINGTYVDSKGDQVVVQNVAESTYGRMVVFASMGECKAMPVKDFKSTFKSYGK